LLSDSKALSRVAKRALSICHFEPDENGCYQDTKEDCEAGCYRCLLSYYNQMDHIDIDRRNPELVSLLESLINSVIVTSTDGRSYEDHYQELLKLCGSSLEQAFLKHLKKHR